MQRLNLKIKHMKKIIIPCLGSLLMLFVLLQRQACAIAQTETQVDTFMVTLEKPENGSIKVSPSIPAGGKVHKGTVITVMASPAAGYAFDGGYFYNNGGRGRMYFESMDPVFQVTVDQNKAIGASFIEKEALAGFTVTQNVIFAQPGIKKLKYDVFSPKGAKNLPCIIIIHGGGWSSNTEDIMRGLARELVKGGKYVVFSIDYRWIGTRDGDKVPNTMANLIEDVYGAIAYIQEHAKEYGADPIKIAVTGDSSGGHLSAAAANMVNRIGDGGFGVKEGIFEFKPVYIPKNKSVQQVHSEITKAIKAAAPSYGVFGGDMLKRYASDNSEASLKAICPIENIPDVKERAVPQLLLRGTSDMLIKDEPVQAYTDALKTAGQTVEYMKVEGASHAFFDWKPDAQTKATFVKYGVPYAAKMKSFFDAVFYPKK
jgi:acetyl esterase/lipase